MARLAQGKASRTARATVAMRHRHHAGGIPPLVFDDAFAKYFLDLPSLLIAAPTPVSDWALGRTMGPVRALEGEVLARSRYVEEALTPRLAEGVGQVVILGAGFDTTALRHTDSDCRFYEVDHPATQAAKRAILAKHPELEHDTVFVPVDFAKDDLAEALLAAGWDRTRPGFVSWLGVTMYLEQAVTMATLAKLRAVMAPGSPLIFDAFPRSEDGIGNEQLMFGAVKAFTASRGEPMPAGFDMSAFAAAVENAGWRIADIMRGDAMRETWFAHQPKAIWPPRSALFYTLEAV